MKDLSKKREDGKKPREREKIRDKREKKRKKFEQVQISTKNSSLFTLHSSLKYGGVAQLGEHLPCKQGVMGSNPIISTTGRGSGAINRLNLTKLSGRERTTKTNEGESRVRGRPR